MVNYFVQFFSVATCTQLRTSGLTMRNIQLQLSFLFLFTWKLFIVVGNAYPVINLNNEEIVKNNIIKKNVSIQDTVVSATTYTCVHIPSNLEPCKFR